MRIKTKVNDCEEGNIYNFFAYILKLTVYAKSSDMNELGKLSAKRRSVYDS